MASVAQLDGLFKQLYAKKIEDAVPAAAHLLKKIPFTPKEMQNGNFYNQPVILTQEQGWSYLPAGGSTTLFGNVDMQLKNAQVLGNIIAGQSQLSVEAAKRAVSGGPAAFEDAVGLQMRVMMESGRKRQEINFLYGNTPLALVQANTTVSGNQLLTIKNSEWASGFWSGMQNARLDAYLANGTKLNQGGALTVVTSNAAQTSILITGGAGDLSNVSSNVNTSPNTVQLWFYNAFGNESVGIKGQLINTGTLFNINAAAFDLWNGSTYVSNGNFVLANLQSAIAVAVGRGLDEEVDVYVSPETWTNLLSDQAALRRFAGSTPGEFVNGAEELQFYGQNGPINIIPHIYVKRGDAFILPMDKVKRIGVSQMTFDIPGTDKGRIFIQQANSLSFEYRIYSQETIFLEMPARCVYVSNCSA